MATSSQKRKPAARSSGCRQAAPSSGSGHRTSTPSRTTRGSASSRPVRREVGAVVCLLLALFAALGYFNANGVFINFLSNLLKGLIGYGYWFMPPALLVGAYILGFHRGRPVRLRLFCALALPVMLGAMLHLFLSKGEYPWAWAMFRSLWTDGLALRSGGALGGVLSLGLSFVFSVVGAGVVMVLLTLLMFLGAFNRTVEDVVESVRSRPRREYEPPEEPEEEEDEDGENAAAPLPRRNHRRVDIPLDDHRPPVGKIHVELDDPPQKKRGFFSKEREVPTPEEFLTGSASKPSRRSAHSPEEAEDLTPPEEDETDPFPDPVKPEPVKEPVKTETKVTREDAAQAAQEVSQEIAGSLEDPAPAYQYPPLSLLSEGTGVSSSEALGELKRNQERLADTIRSFGVDATIVNVVHGPSVTRYEMELDQGVKLSRVTNLADDIALALGAEAVRIAPIPDKISTVGIEVPNKLVATVHIRDVVDDPAFRNHTSKVAFAVGKDIGGNAIVGNIAKLPHLLIAGTTGSGKSVCTNSLIISLLYKATPEEVRLIMVDPKMVELGIYNGIPHLLIPVVTDPKKAAGALQWAVTEMMKRYRAFSEIGVRDLASYNAKAVKTEGMSKMPQVVVLIDELADLMLVAAKEVEESICRVAQMGRAAGMHLVIATQRPSADVITGLMKANIPSRIAFAVSSSLESRIILDTTGAEKLVGKGDMLWFPLGAGKPHRVQGCFVKDEEVAAVVNFIKESSTAAYDESVMEEIEQHAQEKEKGGKSTPADTGGGPGEDSDELLPAAIEVVVELGQASVSMLQRRLKLGYGRAARLVDQMEEMGVVGPSEGSKPRQVLITRDQWQEMQFRQGFSASPVDDDTPPFDMDDSSDDDP